MYILQMRFIHNRPHLTEIRPHMTMKQRTQMTNKICADLKKPVSVDNLTLVDIPPRLLISDRYKILTCVIDKVASTNIRRIFYVLKGLTNESDPGKILRGVARNLVHELYRNYKPNLVAEVIPRLKSYTTFMFVRHPLERLVSAYRDGKPGHVFKKFKPNFNEYIDMLLQNKSYYSKLFMM